MFFLPAKKKETSILVLFQFSEGDWSKIKRVDANKIAL